MSYIVKSKPREGFKGFWRDGKFWTNEGIEVESVSDAVLNESMLIVEEIGNSETKEAVPAPKVSVSKPKTTKGK